MDLNDVKAGDYELVSELFDQPKSKPDDKVFLFKRYVKGDIVTLDEDEAKRLVAAGAVVEPGARERAILAAAQAQYEAAKALFEASKAALPVDPAELEEEVSGTDQVDLAALNLDQLTAYAVEQNIDLGKATSEDGIRAKITEAQQV